MAHIYAKDEGLQHVTKPTCELNVNGLPCYNVVGRPQANTLGGKRISIGRLHAI